MIKIPRFFALFSCVVALCLWLGSCTTPPKTVLLNVGVGGVFRDVIVKIINLYQQEKPNEEYGFKPPRVARKTPQLSTN